MTNKNWTGRPSSGQYHRRLSSVSLEARLVSDPDVPLKKPSAPVQIDGSPSAVPSSSDEVSFLRLPDVKLVTGLSKSSLYALIRANSFPAPVQLGPRTVAWVRSEIKQWAAERILTSRTAPHSQSGRRTPQRATAAWPAAKKWA